jgi:hypothetical protein
MTERNKKILELANDGIQEVELAKKYGITKQRIEQILKKQGFVRRKFVHFCATPGCPRVHILPYRKRGEVYCATCRTYKSIHKRFPEMKMVKRHHEKRECSKCGYKQLANAHREFWSKDICKRCGIKEYRRTHPEYVEKMRTFQEVRNKSEYHREYIKRNYVMSMLPKEITTDNQSPSIKPLLSR